MDSENNCDVSKRCKSGGKHKLKGFYLFERCSGGILNLKFDSDVLESFYYKCSYPSAKGRFRFGTAFSTFLSVVWLIYFSIVQPPSYLMYINGFTLGAVVSIAYFIMSFVDRIFRARAMCICSSHAWIICLLSLFTFVPPEPGATLAFNLSLVLQLVLITYTMAPLRLWQLLALCGPVSILQIILASVRYGQVPGWFVLIFFVGHLCVHLIGINLHLMSQVWRRSTFLRMGYNALMRKALKKEQEIRDDMIRSLMPNQVAQEVMREVGNDSGIDSGNDNDNCNNNTDNNNDNSTLGKNKKYKKKSSKQSQHRRLKKQKLKNETDNMENDYLDSKGFKINGFSYMGDGEDSDEDDETQTSKKISVGSNCEQMTAGQDELEIGVGGTGGSSPRSSLVPKSTVLPARAVAFRKFHVNQLENVSVLFADIVGFTKMSSNKSASHLVYLLNDLFGRFDRLCEIVGCEKIATLGDCYYCVAGCPNPVDDHAERTVEMGRAMCLAIQQFDEDHSEQVNMRVGVHTGNVICGIVGTRRFKFDVWSNDVTLANEMESSGEAGKVHISEATLSFVKDIYEVSEGKPVQDIRKFKVLIEFFNKEEQCFAIKHTQDEAMIKTYFIERRLDNKPVVSLPPAQIEVESVSPQCDKVYTAGTNSSINLSNSQTINTVPVSLPPPTTSSSPTPDHQHPLMTKSDPVGVVSSGDNPSSNQLPQSSVDNKSLPMNTTITTTTTTTTTAITTNTVASTAATTVNTTPTANTTTLQSFIGRGSDVEMLQALQDFVQPDEVFIFPPISRLTLNFFVPIVEHSYRSLGLKRPKIHSIEKLSWSTPRIAPFINTITETILIIIIALTCFIIFPDSRLTVNTPGFYIILLIAFIIHTLLLVLFISDLAAWAWCPRRRDNNAKLLTKKSQNRNDWRRIVIRLYGRLFRWKSRNIIGVFILILPTALILSCYSYCLFTSYTSTSVIRKWNTIYSPLLYATYRTQIGLLFTFMFINCTLYTSFSSWTKTISATFVCLLGILLIGLHKVIQSTCSSRHIQSWYPVMLNNFNVSDTNQIPVSLSSSSSMSSPVYPLWLYTALSDSAISEYILIALLTLILVGMLNREFDINFRLSFHRDYEALRAKQAIGHQKLQADWLLENIIPYYIMNDLRQHNKYSQHIEDAGVVFACIANFSEFYDEQYQGGQEMLRVLNEIFADFEHQLAAPKYKDVEKIKTIGACFMAASGLNMTERKRNKQPDEHLWALLDFALDLIHTLDDFNRQMFNFQFELKVGYNIGEVTAGVIGTTKLLYDIWGDTVNVASRMYSTGLKGRIQVAETVAKRLESRYIFEYRGEVFVKGKGDMKTYLLVSRRNDKRDSK